MERWVGDSAHWLGEAWAGLTAGALAIYVEGALLPGEATRPSYPPPVRRALEDHSSLEALRASRRNWWVTAPDPAAGGGVQIVAWAAEDRGWGTLLRTWSVMLSHLVDVSSTAAGLTSELINAWDR